MNCERVKLPPFSSSWAEAITCQHHTIINWNNNGTKWFNCGLGIDAESEHNVNKTLNDELHLASLVWPVARKRDTYLHDVAWSTAPSSKGSDCKAGALKMRRCCSKTMSPSIRRRGPSREKPPWQPWHKNVKALRAAAVNTNSEHEPLPPYFDTTWSGHRTAERHASKNVATRVDSVCVDSPTCSRFCRKMPRPSGLTTFFLHFVGFVLNRRRWRGCGSSRDVHVDKRHVLHKLLRRGLGKSGNTIHTLDIARDRGPRVCSYKRRVSFQKDRTQIIYFESFSGERV